jgi:aryl-alcohol dehydrogenase-like predicted oxidoreductase
MNEQPASSVIPLRPLGRTGGAVSALGLGGWDIAVMKDDRDCIRLVHEAIDAGITFLDNAWDYHDGRSEELMGRAIEDRRDRVFLMTKVCTHGRDRRVAMRQLEESLRRLRTDYLDLWQIHEVVYENEPELHFAPDGVIESLDQARREGKVRFVGFTGHKSPELHLRMLAYNYPFDACQLPLNCLDATFRSFERQVLPELERQNIAAIGMKSMGGDGVMVTSGVVAPDEALRYAMSLPVATTVSGICSFEILQQNLKVARGFTPMSASEMQQLRKRCASAAADGRFEMYKTTAKFEGPEGRRQHGFPPHSELPV